MSGVEAAASLFGSEESSADLFATLGTDSSSAPADDFFAGDSSASAPAQDPFETSSHSNNNHAEPAGHSEYAPSSEKLTHSMQGRYDTAPNGHATDWPQPIVSDYSSSYMAPQSTVTPAYDPYAPSTYSSQTTSYSSYNAYDPPAPTTTSPYSPYSPGSHPKVSPVHSYTSAVPSSAPHSQPYISNTASIPTVPPPPPKTTTVTRPKVSNAYDPPFIPTRRTTTRTASNPAPTYSPYQTPSPYAAPSAYTQYQQPPVPPPPVAADRYRAPLKAASPVNYPTGPSQTHTSSVGTSFPVGQASRPVYERTQSPSYNSPKASERLSPIPNHSPTQYVQAPPSTTNLYENHVPEETNYIRTATPSLEDTSPSHERHDTRVIGYSESGSQETVSPRNVPLPFSPPTQKEELEDHDGGLVCHNEPSVSPPPQHSPYIPQQTVKKDLPSGKDVLDPYAPRLTQTTNNYIPRTSSPLSISARAGEPPRKPPGPPPPSQLNGTTPSLSYISVPKPPVGIPPPLNVPSRTSIDDYAPKHITLAPPQELVIKNSLASQYAPSPSLIGANDPLSRTSARAPVVTFGFGGKIVTCFHGMPGLNAGFDVALSSRTSSELKIHNIKKVIPTTILDAPGPTFPGPLLADPGTSSISLVRSGQTTQTKTKKVSLVTYLADRSHEIQQGLGYLSPAEQQIAEDKIILLKLLSIMIENDGRLLGTPQSDTAVRTALVPRLETLSSLQDGLALQASFSTGSLDEAPISVTTLRSSALDKIEEFLLQGDRRQAYQYAMDQKLFAHAMIIASSIDKDSWKEVVNDFLRTELGSKEDAARGSLLKGPIQPVKNSRESLRVAYSLFSGQGATAVQELAHVTLLQGGRLPPPPPTTLLAPVPPTAPTLTPRTPNFPVVPSTASVPPEALDKWAETTAMILSSSMTPEISSALIALGDQLLANNRIEAAHACYLLTSQPSLLGGLGNPTARITLVGSKNPAEGLKNPEVIVYSEILEFAMSLLPVAKGQEAFHGLAHLQAYRFIRAMLLAEVGDVQLANRYCDAIASSSSNTSPYTTVAFSEQLQGLQQRLSGVFHGDKSGSWIGGKISKPSLDTIGGWLEGRFTKLVTGDSNESTPIDPNKASGQVFAGPFAHYSTISSTTPSGRSSPQPNIPSNFSTIPPHRAASAMASSSPYAPQAPIERSSSAHGYARQPPSVQTTMHNNGSMSSSQSSPTAYGVNGYSRYNDSHITPTSETGKEEEDEASTAQTASWWNSTDTYSNSTPTAATFMKVEESSMQTTSDGFISLMDTQSFSINASHYKQSPNSSQNTIEEEEDLEDLGLGNSKPKVKAAKEQESVDTSKTDSTTGDSKPPARIENAAPTNGNNTQQIPGGGSWFGRWWKRGDTPTTPGPVKASLGEESTFYYDKEMKRWVNKKAGTEEAPKAAAPPPPPSRVPSRAQTASPGMTGAKAPPPSSGPPTRPASAMDLSTEPHMKAPIRIRSNLAPPTESAPSTPTGTRMNAGSVPPPVRPKSGAAKRNVRSRYVDVFQQESGGAA